MSQLSLVASAISSIINCPVKTSDECEAEGLKFDPSQILDLDTFHKRSLTCIEFNEPAPAPITSPSNNVEIQIFVRLISGNTQSMIVNPSITVLELKRAIHEKLEIDVESMRLIFAGKQLEDQHTLTSYNIQKECTITILLRIPGGSEPYVITNDFLDPSFNYDFTNINDNGKTFKRGKELYKRPCGWKRIALNVRRYGDKTWLGCVGDSPHEWPVSYHGTKKEFAESIANEGYLLSRGRRFAYGRGIYSSPDINTAERFAIEFNHNNVRYKVVLQNRVNPAELHKHYNDTYWVTPKNEDIRPYGLCIKRS